MLDKIKLLSDAFEDASTAFNPNSAESVVSEEVLLTSMKASLKDSGMEFTDNELLDFINKKIKEFSEGTKDFKIQTKIMP